MSVAAKLREVLQKTIIYDKKLREAGCETSWNEINRGSGRGRWTSAKCQPTMQNWKQCCRSSAGRYR